MRIGAPTEIKSDEFRVSLTPAGVRGWSPRATKSWYLSEGKTLFTYLHLATDAELARLLCESDLTPAVAEAVCAWEAGKADSPAPA